MAKSDDILCYWLNDELTRRSGTGFYHLSARQQENLLATARERWDKGDTIREIVRDWQLRGD